MTSCDSAKEGEPPSFVVRVTNPPTSNGEMGEPELTETSKSQLNLSSRRESSRGSSTTGSLMYIQIISSVPFSQLEEAYTQ